jgi:hypothetical protein
MLSGSCAIDQQGSIHYPHALLTLDGANFLGNRVTRSFPAPDGLVVRSWSSTNWPSARKAAQHVSGADLRDLAA